MTEKLFWDDPYLKECEARVIEVKDKEVKLDRTIFYAFSGGQASDSGSIGGVKVKEAIKKGREIVYILEEEPEFKAGEIVKVSIDWNKRYKIMRLHSAAHIVYYFLNRELGIEKLIGSNISQKKARLDFEYPESVKKYLEKIEEKANEFISRGYEIKTYADKSDKEKRWWECENIKYPCGGTHVKNTKEIGMVKLKRKNIGKGKERVEIFVEGEIKK